jgi:hypothetical protein
MNQNKTQEEIDQEEFLAQWIKDNPKRAKMIDTEE